jgi:hypothetical protein
MTIGYALNGYAILTARDTWPIRIPGYRGVCRGAWWPLREYERGDETARALSNALEGELLGQLSEPQLPDAIVDAQLLRKYSDAAAILNIPLYGLLCASPVARASVPNWTRSLQKRCEYLGIDICYPSGSYSFLNGVSFVKDSALFEFMRANLNPNGLLSNPATASEFLRRYDGEVDRGANWETLEGAMPIELWHDPDLTQLKQTWAG